MHPNTMLSTPAIRRSTPGSDHRFGGALRDNRRMRSGVAPGVCGGAAGLLDRLTVPSGRQDRLTHLEVIPAREGLRAPWPEWAAREVVGAWRARGVPDPWRRKVEAADAARTRQCVAPRTGTASGKSLSYLLPALTEIQTSRGRGGQRGAPTLYVAPTKALAQ